MKLFWNVSNADNTLNLYFSGLKYDTELICDKSFRLLFFKSLTFDLIFWRLIRLCVSVRNKYFTSTLLNGMAKASCGKGD